MNKGKDKKSFKGLCKVQFIAQKQSIKSRLAEGYSIKKIWADLKEMELFTGSYNTFRLHHDTLIRGKNTPKRESQQEESTDEISKNPDPTHAATEKEPIRASTVKKSTAIKADATRAANIPKDQLY